MPLQELQKPARGMAAFASVEFCPRAAEGPDSLVALTTAGKLFCFHGIDLARLRQAIAERDMATAAAVCDPRASWPGSFMAR